MITTATTDMKQAIAVIGGGFGDEGKGLMTDALTRKHGSTLTARFNGGAQAGHTVKDGQLRHVFGHIGAGTFAGASTYLSSKFIVNPLILKREIEKLQITPKIYVHPQAQISTIFDMRLNAAAELARGIARHGSCGLGINETVTRHLAGFGLTAGEFDKMYTTDIMNFLIKIQDQYYRPRVIALGLPDDFDLDLSRVAYEMWLGKKSLSCGVPAGAGMVILEGAQGLGLDEYLGVFPHVTRSITGLPYALVAAHELGCTELQPYYVTRAYQTRHGAGSLRYEAVSITDAVIVDETNVHNEFQGTLRYAPLNVQAIKELIRKDLERGAAVAQALDIKIVDPKFAITCLDQLGDEVRIIDHLGVLACINAKDLPQTLARALGPDVTLDAESRGPEYKDVRFKLGILEYA